MNFLEVSLEELMDDEEKLKEITARLDYCATSEASTWKGVLEELYETKIVKEKNFSGHQRNIHGGGSPSKAFLNKLKTEQPETTIEDFIKRAAYHKRNDVSELLKSFVKKRNDELNLMKELGIKETDDLAKKLDQNANGLVSDWIYFADDYGFNRVERDTLKLEQARPDEWSPTRSVLKSVITNHPGYSLTKFAAILQKIHRIDVKLKVEEFIEEAAKNPRSPARNRKVREKVEEVGVPDEYYGTENNEDECDHHHHNPMQQDGENDEEAEMLLNPGEQQQQHKPNKNQPRRRRSRPQNDHGHGSINIQIDLDSYYMQIVITTLICTVFYLLHIFFGFMKVENVDG